MPGKVRTESMCCARDWVRRAIACVLLSLLAGCAGMPRDASMPISDPNEAANRDVLATNQRALGPVSEAVRTAVPGPVHDRLHDLNSNLKEPRIFLNDVLQLRLDAAARTAGRFVVNSTFGIGGRVSLARRSGRAHAGRGFRESSF